MITINLVPAGLRKKHKKNTFFGLTKNIPQEILTGIFVAFAGFLIATHGLVQFVIIGKFAQHSALGREWNNLSPKKKKVDDLLKELRTLQAKVKTIEKITTDKDILWAEIFNVIGNEVPRGVWLKKISLANQGLVIEGSAVSRNKNEMTGIHSFTASLKSNAYLASHLAEIELGLIQRRPTQAVEISDFTITAKLITESSKDQ